MNSPPKPTEIKSVRAAHAETRIAQIITILDKEWGDAPWITEKVAREIAALYDRALREAEELIDNLFGELEDFPPPDGDAKAAADSLEEYLRDGGYTLEQIKTEFGFQPAGDEVEAAALTGSIPSDCSMLSPRGRGIIQGVESASRKPAAEREEAIREAIDALVYAYAGVLSVTADKVNFQIIPALAALLSNSGDRT